MRLIFKNVYITIGISNLICINTIHVLTVQSDKNNIQRVKDAAFTAVETYNPIDQNY
jgi:hypothetical protein